MKRSTFLQTRWFSKEIVCARNPQGILWYLESYSMTAKRNWNMPHLSDYIVEDNVTLFHDPWRPPIDDVYTGLNRPWSLTKNGSSSYKKCINAARNKILLFYFIWYSLRAEIWILWRIWFVFSTSITRELTLGKRKSR